jgi:hypothetical protein
MRPSRPRAGTAMVRDLLNTWPILLTGRGPNSFVMKKSPIRQIWKALPDISGRSTFLAIRKNLQRPN